VFSMIRLQALTECPGMFGSSFEVESKYTPDEWKKWMQDDGRIMFGLFEKEEPIGMTGIVTSWDDPACGVMIASYIKPDYRGQGLSSLLYEARMGWAKAYPAWKKLMVGHREGNEASRRANQRHGFAYTMREATDWPDGTRADVVRYEIDLEQLRQTK
jgi:RimJ/RimL family protein N-acetyltransferase